MEQRKTSFVVGVVFAAADAEGVVAVAYAVVAAVVAYVAVVVAYVAVVVASAAAVAAGLVLTLPFADHLHSLVWVPQRPMTG